MSSADQKSTETSSEHHSTIYEKVSTAFGYPPETEAHKAGREAVEAVNEAVDGAVKVVHDAIVPEPVKPKTVGEVAYEGVAETATQMKEATNQAIGQVKEAVHPTPPPKTTGEVIGETIDDAATKASECYEGAKEAMAAKK